MLRKAVPGTASRLAQPSIGSRTGQSLVMFGRVIAGWYSGGWRGGISEGKIDRARRDLFLKLQMEIRDNKVIEAMMKVRREAFVSEESRHLAYMDIALPIGDGQTISQPYIVALMVSILNLTGGERVMEIGTGSGYQAAVLSQMVPSGMVLTLERIPSLADSASELLRSLECNNVEVRDAGAVLGCPEMAPFDAIIVAAAAPRLPENLLTQLAVGGRMVIPLGDIKEQQLTEVRRTGEGYSVSLLVPCRFVPLVGEEAWSDDTEQGEYFD